MSCIHKERIQRRRKTCDHALIKAEYKILLSRGARYRLFEDPKTVTEEVMYAIDEYIMHYFPDEKYEPLCIFFKKGGKKSNRKATADGCY